MGESIIFHRAIQEMRLPERQPPILLAKLGKFPNPTSITTLRELSINMYKTHRGETDAIEVFREQITLGEGEGDPKQTGPKRFNWQMKRGAVFDESKKPVKSRNMPGKAESASRGAGANFQGLLMECNDRGFVSDVAIRVTVWEISPIRFARYWVRSFRQIARRKRRP